MHATAAAPAGAGGVAGFENSSGGAALSATIENLGTGTYIVSAVTRGNGRPVTLGRVVVTDPTAAPDPDTNENRKERNTVNQAQDVRVQVRMQLPQGLAPGDIAEVRVYGSGGVVLLSGKASR